MQSHKALTRQARLGETSHVRYQIFNIDAFEWLQRAPMNSIHAVVTDPPYGLVEYSEKELAKLKGGRGGVWRLRGRR